MRSEQSDTDRVLADIQRFIREKAFGKYRGKVKSVDKETGMIAAVVPAVFDATTEVSCRPCLTFAGDKHGVIFLPEEEDVVWVEFEGGDKRSAIWSGFTWAEGENPAEFTDKVRGIITSQKLQFLLDDQNNEIVLKNGSNVEIKMSENEIVLKVKQCSIKITGTGIDMNEGTFEVKK